MEFGIVELSRLQFALTAMDHLLFVPLTPGLPILIAIMARVLVMTRRPVRRRMTMRRETTACAGGPRLVAVPAMGILGGVLTFPGLRKGRGVWTPMVPDVAIPGVASWVGLTMFPLILPMPSDPRSSLTVWNRSSSYLMPVVMLAVTLIFLPLILMHGARVCGVRRGKVTAADATDNPHAVC